MAAGYGGGIGGQMLNVYMPNEGAASRLEGPEAIKRVADGIWADLLEPSREEELAVEAVLGIDIPSREEMREVESSSLLYRRGNATVATIRVLSVTNRSYPLLAAITFLLTPERLVTLRYAEPTPFQRFGARALAEGGLLGSAAGAMTGLLEAIVDRVADLLEQVGDESDRISASLFTQSEEAGRGIVGADLNALLQGIGRNGDLAARARDSLHTISRVLPVLQGERDVAARVATLQRDVKSLVDYANNVSGTIQFLLDSALGLISIQQNAIIKIFSVAAVIFLPPTLIASIYGMNFEHMPELKWVFGYPWALGLMVVSAILPYWYFKRRHWL